jgi:hypothetical protein
MSGIRHAHAICRLARQALRKLLAEPMRFEPVVAEGRKTYKIIGKTKVGALLDPNYIEMASPRGVESIPTLRADSPFHIKNRRMP